MTTQQTVKNAENTSQNMQKASLNRTDRAIVELVEQELKLAAGGIGIGNHSRS
jgi:hypothetical protein